jgi:hypothetical protein
MTRRRTIMGLFALLALALVPGACKQSDSILLVEVYGPAMLDPLQLSVTVTVGVGLSEGRNFNVPTMARDMSDPITLPTSFTIALDRSLMAPVQISIDALDATGSPLAGGTTTMQHIEIGGQTDISVMLNDTLPPGSVDGGVDAGSSDATGQGGASGQGGAGGQGGASGQGGGGQAGTGGQSGAGGASGTDAGADGDDAAMGLDGATD